jgi:hypothetical protein
MHKCQRFYFGHTLLWCLSLLYMSNKLTSEIRGNLSNKRSCLARALVVTKSTNVSGMILVTLCHDAHVWCRCPTNPPPISGADLLNMWLWLCNSHSHNHSHSHSHSHSHITVTVIPIVIVFGIDNIICLITPHRHFKHRNS